MAIDMAQKPKIEPTERSMWRDPDQKECGDHAKETGVYFRGS